MEALTVWTKCPWNQDADEAIGELIKANKSAMLASLEAGSAELYRVVGPIYSGWLLGEFRTRTVDGALVYKVHAFAGRNVAAGLNDLGIIAKKAGAVSLICESGSRAHHRLYERIGFDEDSRIYVKDL